MITKLKKKHKMIPEIRNEFIYGKQSTKDNDGNVTGMLDKNSKYCKGAVNNNFTEEMSKDVFDTVEAFAKYAFNKSHSGAYAKVGYKTAWLSCYYPVEWAISCMSHYDEQDKITETLSLCKKRNIPIYQPSINYSDKDFTIDTSNNTKGIRYGLLAIKDVGIEPIKYIKKIRLNEGNFVSFDDFYNKVHDKDNINKYSEKQNKKGEKQCPINKKCEIALIKAGAFDDMNENRYELLNHYMIDIRREKDYQALDVKDFSRKIKLAYEKELMGGYISEHPLEPFPYVDLTTCKDNEVVEITGIVKKTSIKTTKNNKKYATCFLESKDGTEFRTMLFGALYTNNKDKLKKDNILVIDGVYNAKYNNIKGDKIRKVRKKSQIIRIEDTEDGIEDYSEEKQETIQMPVVDDNSDNYNINMENNPVDFILNGGMI